LILLLDEVLESTDFISQRVAFGLELEYLLSELLDFPPFAVELLTGSLLFFDLFGETAFELVDDELILFHFEIAK
jgi:hypothetical protein